MKKITVFVSGILTVLLIVVTVFTLKGSILESSDIISDDDYINYISMKDNGKIDNDNMYHVDSTDPNKIRVSFGKNEYINIKYYSDAALSKEINGTCYLLPGDSIYIKIIDTKNPVGEMYKFFGCGIYEISSTAGREKITTLTKDNPVFKIPDEYTGKELQFIPLGEYKRGLIPVSVFQTDVFNNKETAIGEWFINDRKAPISNGALSIGVGESYVVSCKYNTEEFFYVNSYPNCFSNKNGIITFEQKNSSDNDKPNRYEIELKQYLSFNFEFDKKATIYLNDKLIKEDVKSFEFTLKDKISFGQKIEIKTKSDTIKILGGDYNYINVEREKLSDGYHFVITITDEYRENKSDDKNNGVIIFENVQIKLQFDNKYGKCEYKVNGKILDDTYAIKENDHTYLLKENDELELKYRITNGNYIFSDNNFFERFSKTKKLTITINKNMNGKYFELSDYFDVVTKEG